MPGVVAWNAGAAFSQFAAARAKVGAKQAKITIAHLDTGFDPHHRTLPAGLVTALQRNFVDDGGGPNDATDRAPAGSVTANRGHGTGTLSLLAGNKLAGNSPGWAGFTDFVGGAPGRRSFRCASPTGWSASPPAPWCKASTMPAPKARRCCR